MPQTYATYTAISVNSLAFNAKSQEIISKKQEILAEIESHYQSNPATILFVGFSAWILGATNKQIFVTNINEDTKTLLNNLNIKYTYIDEDNLFNYSKKFDWVVAGDEYFTFAATEEEQRINIETLANLAKELIVTTLRDYKNQEFKDRDFSQPLAVHNHNDHKLFLEYHNYDYTDKNAWTTTVHEIQNKKMLTYGPFSRRSMFFKQIAKFSIDAGAKHFYVHKNLMYKSLIKKNYEHVISISF